jgi:hypothetical protein
VAIWNILWLFGIFCGYLEYFVAIWNILLLFGIFFTFWYVVARKIWQPCCVRARRWWRIKAKSFSLLFRVTRLGRKFVHWVIVFFGRYLENLRSGPNFWATFFHGQ